MISEKHGFIFLHVPKTGGNAIQSLLLPFSDDAMITNDRQDRVERFGVKGPVTPHKHASLQAYSDRLGPRLSAFKVILTLRPPFERMVSLYFSPHRWDAREPIWSEEDFCELARKTPSSASFLPVAGRPHRPDFILRFAHLAEDFRHLVAYLGLPLTDAGLPRRNVGMVKAAGVARILADRKLRSVIEAMFPDDMILLQTSGLAGPGPCDRDRGAAELRETPITKRWG